MRNSTIVRIMNRGQTATLGAVVALAVALAACGGSSEVPATQEPPTAEPTRAEAGAEPTAVVATEAPTEVPTSVPPTAVATTAPTATVPEPTEAAATDAPAPAAKMAQLFTLPSAQDGTQVSLESYRGDKNVVLIFYRGFW